jgi:hypothetical protein
MFGEFFLIMYSVYNFVISLWQIPLFLFLYYNIKYYKVTNSSRVDIILNRIKYSTYTEDDKKRGYFVNFRPFYCGIIYDADGDNNSILYILTYASTYDNLILVDNSPSLDLKSKSKVETKLKLLMPYGAYWRLAFNTRSINYNMKPSPYQKSIITKIINFNKPQSPCKITYLYGEPNKGKSTIAMLTALELNAYYMNDYDPTSPNSSIENLLSYSNECPIVLCIEEADTIIKKFGTIVKHMDFPHTITDKSSWNRFCDNVNIGKYPNIIIIMTSNVSPDTYEDKSLVRDRRCNKIYIK